MSHQSSNEPVQPTNQFGTPIGQAPLSSFPPPVRAPAQGTPAPYAVPYGMPPGSIAPYPYATAPGRSTGVKVAIALGAAAATLVIVGILAAVAIPVFLNQRAKSEAAHISVSLPAQAAGYPRLTGSADAQIQQLVADVPHEMGTPQGAIYGTGNTPRIVIIVGAHPMTAAVQNGYLGGVARSEHASGLTQTPVPAGSLGGQMQCGVSADKTRTDCAFADAGAFGVIDVAGSGADTNALVQQLRLVVEHHS
ncbi:MAG: hypothetical protein M3P23_10460 [Actinomycetota bacterium]|nr:hypothetical protein [Actinomycetota bacterium]